MFDDRFIVGSLENDDGVKEGAAASGIVTTTAKSLSAKRKMVVEKRTETVVQRDVDTNLFNEATLAVRWWSVMRGERS